MRLWFGRRCFGGRLGDGHHGFRSGVVWREDDMENTRIRRICLFLENCLPCLREPSTKDEVNVTSLVTGSRTHQTCFVHFDFPG
jgi:hypothetical protein